MSFLTNTHFRAAFWIAFIYIVAGCLWIQFSDQALNALVTDPALNAKIQTYKGWFYVLTTGILLFGLVARQLRATFDAERALYETQEKFHSVFETLPLAVHGYNEHGKAVFWNSASELMYGYSREEALGKPLMELIIPSQSRLNTAEDIQKQVFENEAMHCAAMTLVRKDGTTAKVHTTRIMLTLPDGSREMVFMDFSLPDTEKEWNIPKDCGLPSK